MHRAVALLELFRRTKHKTAIERSSSQRQQKKSRTIEPYAKKITLLEDEDIIAYAQYDTPSLSITIDIHNKTDSPDLLTEVLQRMVNPSVVFINKVIKTNPYLDKNMPIEISLSYVNRKTGNLMRTITEKEIVPKIQQYHRKIPFIKHHGFSDSFVQIIIGFK